MTKVLLIVHVVAAIIAIGPVAVAASMFPAATRRALGPEHGERDLVTLRLLHRICRVYAVLAVAVPVFGLATAGVMHVMGSPWVIASIGLTFGAALILAGLVLPRQRLALAGSTANPARLAMYTGLFNALWVAVTVLMIVRPGSSTGV